LVFEKVATLQEIESSWSLEDVVKANEIKDFKDEIEAMQAKEQQRKGKK